MSTSMMASCQLLRSRAAGFEGGEKGSLAQPRIARCFLHVSVSPERSHQTRLRITALPPQAQSLVLEIPPVRDRERGFLPWFEVSLALLPGIPLRFTVHDPAIVEPGLNAVLELVKGHVQLRNEGQQEAFIDERQPVLEEDFWFDSLGYTYLQVPWLLQLGAYLVQHHDPGTAYQVVQYLPDRRLYEYRLSYLIDQQLSQYICAHDDVSDVAREHGLDLSCFALGLEEKERRQRRNDRDYRVEPCTLLRLTRPQAELFRQVEAEFGRPDPFDDAGDEPDPYLDTFLVDLDTLRQINPAGATWIERRGYPAAGGSRVTPYAGDNRHRFPELFEEVIWNGYWDVKACALVLLDPAEVQKRLATLP
jgi:hypothetical protein